MSPTTADVADVAGGAGPTGAASPSEAADGDETGPMPAGAIPQVPPACDLTLGVVCTDKATPGRTTWVMDPDERFANPAGVVQGGFVAALCDSAMGASSITWAKARDLKVFCANAELKVSFLHPAPIGRRLTCTARVLDAGRRVAFLEAEVVDDTDRLVAKASSTYVLTPR